MWSAGRVKLVHQRANAPDDINVSALIAPSHIVGFANSSLFGDSIERPRMIVDEQPIANIGAGSINWKRFALESIQNGQWNSKLFREVIRSVIIRTI